MPFTAIHRMFTEARRRFRRWRFPHRCTDCGTQAPSYLMMGQHGRCHRCHAYSENRMHRCNLCGEFFSGVHSYEEGLACEACRLSDLLNRVAENTGAGHTHAISYAAPPTPPPERTVREGRRPGDINIEVTSTATPEQIANIARAMSNVGVSAREAMQRASTMTRALSREFEGRPMLGCTENGEHQSLTTFEDVASYEIVQRCDECGAEERFSMDDFQMLEARSVSGSVDHVIVPIGGTVTGRMSASGPGPRMQVPRQRFSARRRLEIPEPPTGSPPAEPAPNPFVQLGAPRKRPINLDD